MVPWKRQQIAMEDNYLQLSIHIYTIIVFSKCSMEGMFHCYILRAAGDTRLSLTWYLRCLNISNSN